MIGTDTIGRKILRKTVHASLFAHKSTTISPRTKVVETKFIVKLSCPRATPERQKIVLDQDQDFSIIQKKSVSSGAWNPISVDVEQCFLPTEPLNVSDDNNTTHVPRQLDHLINPSPPESNVSTSSQSNISLHSVSSVETPVQDIPDTTPTHTAQAVVLLYRHWKMTIHQK